MAAKCSGIQYCFKSVAHDHAEPAFGVAQQVKAKCDKRNKQIPFLCEYFQALQNRMILDLATITQQPFSPFIRSDIWWVTDNDVKAGCKDAEFALCLFFIRKVFRLGRV